MLRVIGAFQTPQVLELSGIGMPSVLNKFGIKSLIDLPVGENLWVGCQSLTVDALLNDFTKDHALESIMFALTPEAQGKFQYSVLLSPA